MWAAESGNQVPAVLHESCYDMEPLKILGSSMHAPHLETSEHVHSVQAFQTCVLPDRQTLG